MDVLRFVAVCALGTGLLVLPNPVPKNATRISEYPASNTREEQTVVVNGVAETWQLKWQSPPKPVCEPSDTSLTCPCHGFAYGEGGYLDLIRLRNGFEIDRLQISPLFEEQFNGTGRVAVVQRWHS